jgi:hypothetical protein
VVGQGVVHDGEVEAVADLVAQGGRIMLEMKIRGRGERGQPIRERRPAMASGGAAGCIMVALVVAIIGEGDSRGGKRGGQETHK